MLKSKVSDAFASFESRNTHKLEDARKQEKQSRGNPLPVGYMGTAIISDGNADISKAGVPYAVVNVTVVNDPEYEGKSCAGAVRNFKDTEKQTAADAYANFLDELEDMGLSRESRETKNISECLDELLATPHYVTIHVEANKQTRDGKQVKCFAVATPDSSGRAPTAETPITPPSEDDEQYKDLEQCTYLGKPHYIMKDNEDGTFDIMSVKTKKLREDISSDDISMVDTE